MNNKDLSEGKQINAVKNLLSRILPSRGDEFVFEVLPSRINYDRFEINSYSNKIEISGTSGVAIASGLHWYLKYYCNTHFSWSGDQLCLPAKLPLVKKKIIKDTPFQFRYYLNYCTFSYSMPWWNWERWEREIDLMALHGINLPLSIVGHEAVWENVFRGFGLSDDDILSSFAGPAFRAWGWMGNIESWGGSLPQSWIEYQKNLQKKILHREREFGMKPVLQGFAGFVPHKLKKIFPEANIQQLPGWYGFNGVYQIHPCDPLFKKIGRRFMEEQIKHYGTDHFYSADIYHEIDSSIDDKSYLLSLSSAVMDNMKENDANSVWVMQSWSLKEEILDVLPDHNILILDLYCDSNPKWKNNNAFNNKPWIWCALQNFGGRSGLSGKLKLIAEEILNAWASKDKGELCGVGFAPEGIENNPVFFSLLTDMIWRENTPDLNDWMNHFVECRYGRKMEEAEKAWRILLETVYSGPESYGPLESEICAIPSLNIKRVSSNGELNLYYLPEKLVEAWELLLKCSREFSNSPNFNYDLVDLSRQVLVNFAKPLYQEIVQTYSAKNHDEFKRVSELFLQLIKDIDNLLATHKSFLLGKWIEDAKELGNNDIEKNILEWNARRQITLWSTPEINEFHDYANKQWAGLFAGYYLPRWENFFGKLEKCLLENKVFDSNEFQKEVNLWGIQWTHMKTGISSVPIGLSFEVSGDLFEKYLPHFKNVYKNLTLT